jgi:predicted alpha/beta superfamily hydrolase
MKSKMENIWMNKMLATLLCLTLVFASPASHAAGTTIHVHYDIGFGNNISIRGNKAPLSWTTGLPATWTTGNVWLWQTATTMGAYEFKPLSNNSIWSTGGNFVVSASQAAVHIYPFFGPSQGTLTSINNFYSPQLNNSRTLMLYLPPSYNSNSLKRYPVLYMQDGQNLFNAATAFGGVEWQVDENMNSLIGQGKVAEAIVVGIYNNANRISEYTPSVDPGYGGGNANAYLDFVQNTVKPYIDSHFRTLTGPAHTYMLGSSLGGLLSCYAGWTRPTVFGRVGCMSSSFWWNSENFTTQVINYGGARPAVRFYLDFGGNEGGSINPTLRMRDALLAKGYVQGVDLKYYYDPVGTHSEASWRNRLATVLPFLIPWSDESRSQ